MAPAGARDMLCGAQRANLRAVERCAAGAVCTEGARRLTHGIEAGNAGLPVNIHIGSAVLVLGTNGDLQHFVGEINAVLPV